jgi:spermidine synthase
LNDPNKLVFDYTKSYRLTNELGFPMKKALMIGGAAYTYPRDFLLKNPGSTMDVVEIDPKMTEVARKYFYLADDPRMNIVHEDARTFVKKTSNKYDVVFLDAFMGVTPPPHLTTKEFMGDLNNLLTDNGVLMINLISGVSGKKAGLYMAEANTIKTLFPYLDVYMVQNRTSSEDQNLLFVAYKGTRLTETKITDPELSRLLFQKITVTGVLGIGNILTDDHAPVEYLARYSYE